MVVQLPFNNEADARNESRTSHPRVSLLLVSASAVDYLELSRIYRGAGWVLQWVRTADEALRVLRQESVHVIICDHDTAGSWTQVLEAAFALASGPELILACKDVDSQVWAEALNVGARDVLIRPFDRAEVMHVVRLAWLSWVRRQAPVSSKPILAAAR